MNIIKKIIMSVYSRTYVYVHERERVTLSELFEAEQMSKFHHPIVALRYLAVQNHYGENTDGFDLYMRANKANLSDEEAQKDKKLFQDLIKSFENSGYNGSPLIMDVESNIYNGTHRLAICIYQGVREVNVCKGFKPGEELNLDVALSRLSLDEELRERLELAYKDMKEKLDEVL